MVNSQGADPKLPVGGNRCRCGKCGLYFSSVASFDAHRAGDGDARHCFTEPEMRARGMAVNDKGYWVTKAWDRQAASAYNREAAH